MLFARLSFCFKGEMECLRESCGRGRVSRIPRRSHSRAPDLDQDGELSRRDDRDLTARGFETNAQARDGLTTPLDLALNVVPRRQTCSAPLPVPHTGRTGTPKSVSVAAAGSPHREGRLRLIRRDLRVNRLQPDAITTTT